MDNSTRFEDGDLAGGISSTNRAAARAQTPPVDWQPPSSREEAEASIVALSNDIGLILAQLSEDQAAWCQRTGRSPFDYAAWRRRALFAKVHKEHQLRECKRLRFQLMEHGPDAETADSSSVALGRLVAECHRVLAAWRRTPGNGHDTQLDGALAHLAEHLTGSSDGVSTPVELIGAAEAGELTG